ncbi:hydrogenase formation protein HypD [Calderihabitans maritimus]|uniref:Hydrogenase expression/formation protein HypD n=1 Tax=Calderihabitans maritimus TaxID=1246530 RepID=A0A1Z5HPA5_9FIRM|nr:hydrogenase formation protein HypD [Calderihabitans maritimus]GAW91120.1 hydrogenase expression/formation protein HypD [Calderihabitans maritimus]
MNPNKGYRDPARVKAVLDKIYEIADRPVTLMEVCGTHTMAIFRHGIRKLLPANVKLISGPGCPVCVTSHKAVDEAVAIALEPNVIFTTFGDMMRVPGSRISLAQAKASGADVRIVYSPLEAVTLAQSNPDKEVVFFAIGFETTSPTIAASVLTAEELAVNNFSILGYLKTIPNALRVLLSSEEVKIDGLICPGHVSAVIGSEPYEFVAREFGIPAVIAGFEPLDILQSIYMILWQLKANLAKVEIQYRRGVPKEGNLHAMEVLRQVFEPADEYWRGLGIIPGTGLRLKDAYQKFNAKVKFNVEVPDQPEPKGCRCGEVLRGAITPLECPLFAKVCTPEKPVGACMVSVEGTCAAYYKYGR